MPLLPVLTAALVSSSALAGEGEPSVSLLGGLLLTDNQEVLGTSGAIAPRVGYWPRPELGFELDLPFLVGGQTKIDGASNQSYFGLVPNIGVVGRLFPESKVSLLLSASLGGTLKQLSDAPAFGYRPADNIDLDFAALAGPGVLVSLTDALNLRAEWRGMLNVGPLNTSEDFALARDVFTDGMLLVGLTYLKSGPPDTDGDGSADDADQCIDSAEDVDSFQDADGCPDDDNDGDGLADTADQCRDAAEDVDKFEDDNGCPDPDNDGDSILDGDDKCPLKPGTAATEGCPDTDGDGVIDRLDECKTEPGVASAFGCPDRDGDLVPDGRDKCPDAKAPDGIDPRRSDGCPAKFYIAADKVVILEQVKFLTGKATIQKSSFGLLDGVANIFVQNPGVKLIQVEGHTDNQGADDANLKLSQARADAVKEYLVAKGVAAERLVAKGFGESKPIGDNATALGRQANRRVEFNILEQEVGSTVVED